MHDLTPNTLVSNWVCPESVRALVSFVSHLVGYRFDDADWVAIEFGIEGTDAERDLWFSYPIVGVPTVEIAFAAEPEADPVHVRLQSSAPVEHDLLIRLETTLEIFNAYDLR